MLNMRCRLLTVVTVAAAAQPSVVTVDWATVLKPLSSTVGFQTVVNPVTARESPYHDQVYEKIASLGSSYQRYVPWLPYPRMGIAELERPSHGGLCGFVNSGGAAGLWSTSLDCGSRNAGFISSVVFADYGLPNGYCNELRANAQCTKDVTAAVKAACVGKASCTLASNDAVFGASPCAGNRLAVEVTCSNKAVQTYTYWDFKLPDEGMIDFLTAANSSVRTSIPNFSTIPNWLFNNSDRSYFPDDPLGETFSYEAGSVLVDPTGAAVGDYYGRLLAHYIEPGGFVDEAGNTVPGAVGGPYSFSHWEVLNEVNSEHHMTPAFYTILYDAIVAGIRKWAPTGSARLKFFGLGGAGEEYIPYFLNKSNHASPAPPIDFVTVHSYASATRNGTGTPAGVPGAAYTAFFPHADGFINSLKSVYAVIAASDYPDVLIDADEVGIILPDDNDPKWTADEPGFPAVYWNAAAAMYAYMYGTGAIAGLDVLGESQLIGYPSIPFPRGPPYNGPWTAPPQYPSVSMLSWGGAFGQPGDGTARYWALKLLIDNFKAGPPAGSFSPAEADAIVNTSVSGGSGPLSSPFCGSVINLDTLSLFCASGLIDQILYADYGTPSGDCGTWRSNATCTSPTATAIVTAACVGKASCSVVAGPPNFGDPCLDTVKYMDVQATCSTGGGAQQSATTDVFAQGFLEAGGARKVLVVNKSPFAQNVSLAGAAGGTFAYIDESTAYGPAATVALAADVWMMAPYGLGVVRLAA
jgi:hypothetical protein